MTPERRCTPPIDILALAADRVATANAAINGTRAMQAGPATERAYWHALVARDLALADMVCVQRLAQMLAGA